MWSVRPLGHGICTAPHCSHQQIIHFITEDAPVTFITQEITRVFGTLCQELGAETKYIISYYVAVIKISYF